MAKSSEKSRINLLNDYLRNEFGEKVVKLSLDGGFTCPNRDGLLGFGGCSFCSAQGSGEQASSIDKQIELLSKKWPNVHSYIAYFQNYTGTYAPISKLRELYYDAILPKNIVGLAIATRPDCLPEETLDLLSELNEKTFLWVELGLQTCNDTIAHDFGRGYRTEVYHKAMDELNKRNIRSVTHLLFGLPGETEESMLSNLREIRDCNLWGVKYHLLNIIKGTRMWEEQPGYSYFKSPEHYASFICDLLEETPSETIIHRLSADSPKETLDAPKWAYRKKIIIDLIKKEMEERNAFQGDKI